MNYYRAINSFNCPISNNEIMSGFIFWIYLMVQIQLWYLLFHWDQRGIVGCTSIFYQALIFDDCLILVTPTCHILVKTEDRSEKKLKNLKVQFLSIILNVIFAYQMPHPNPWLYFKQSCIILIACKNRDEIIGRFISNSTLKWATLLCRVYNVIDLLFH